MNILNVAQNPLIAKEITKILSNGSYNKYSDFKFNPVYEFNFSLKGKNENMIFTSVSGHLMKFEFLKQFKKWNQNNLSLLLKKSK